MSIKVSICATCKKCNFLDEAPWYSCKVYKEQIPEEYYKNSIGSKEKIKCKDYEFNPDWQERYDE